MPSEALVRVVKFLKKEFGDRHSTRAYCSVETEAQRSHIWNQLVETRRDHTWKQLKETRCVVTKTSEFKENQTSRLTTKKENFR